MEEELVKKGKKSSSEMWHSRILQRLADVATARVRSQHGVQVSAAQQDLGYHLPACM